MIIPLIRWFFAKKPVQWQIVILRGATPDVGFKIAEIHKWSVTLKHTKQPSVRFTVSKFALYKHFDVLPKA